jgi:selenocysteine lyase/cysteine desulfurase
VMSEEEHPSAWVPIYWLRERFGVEISEVRLPHSSEGMVEAITAAMTPKTKLVLVSHVSCHHGLRVPERLLADAVHDKGALLYLDGAQSSGQFPIDLHSYDCDLYCTSLHKWVLAPLSSGLFYVRDSLIDSLKPAGGGPSQQFDFQAYLNGTKTFTKAFGRHAGKFDYGSRDWNKIAGVVAAVDYINNLGQQNVTAHVKSLVDPLKRELQSIGGVTLTTPMDDAIHGNGIISFQIEGVNAADFRDKLGAEENIYVRTIDEANATRVSVALFTNQADLDIMLGHIHRAARKGL